MDNVSIDLNIDNSDSINDIPDDIVSLTNELIAKKSNYTKRKQEATDLYKEVQVLETRLHTRMEDSGFKSFKTDDATVFRKYQYWATITDERKAAEFFAEEGIEDEMFKTSIVKGRLNDMVRRLVKEGLALPDGIDYTIKPTIGIRKI